MQTAEEEEVEEPTVQIKLMDIEGYPHKCNKIVPSIMNRSAVPYILLFVLQIILIILFFIFGRYPDNVFEVKRTEGFGETQAMIFVGFGFLMSFLKKYSYSAIGFNLLLSGLAIQLSLFCQPLFVHGLEHGIVITRKSLIEADVLTATVLISFGALLGIASCLQLVVMTVIEIILAALNFYLVFEVFKASDPGGSIAIHAFGAYFGLGVSAGLRKRIGENVDLNKPTYVGDVTAMIGTLFLWIYWPFFNAATAFIDFSNEAEIVYTADRAVVNTYLALAAATVTSFFLSATLCKHNVLDMVHIQNSTLAGGVAVGTLCHMDLKIGGALCVGTLAGVISVCGYKYLTPLMAKIPIQDTCGVHNLHGMPGFLSGLLSVVLSKVTWVGPSMELFYAEGKPVQQLLATVVTVVFASITGVLTGLLLSVDVFDNLGDPYKYNDEVNWELPETLPTYSTTKIEMKR